MSDQPWVVKAPFPPIVRPEFVLGAALPLWGFVTGAVVTGTAWWWMTRWMQAGEWLAPAPAKPSTARLVLVSENTALVPVGGEAAPVAPAALADAVLEGEVLEGEVLEGPQAGAELAAAPVGAPKSAARRRAKDAETKPR